MTLKKDLKDIGIFMITPSWRRHLHPEVNFKRAATQSSIGGLVLQVALVGGVLYGPVIMERIDDTKKWIESKKIDRYNKKNNRYL